MAEATYKVMKTEFIYQMEFRNLRHLELELNDYVNWFNSIEFMDRWGIGFLFSIAKKP
ncbi:IS3 family transposase [Paenibacillus sp. FSL K6-0108]|uniref:IS3 family transposase n=1 Tax=Paenibacillus sp. FSL K6-0108 TaxID=2921417 RepID=UPI003245DF35